MKKIFLSIITSLGCWAFGLAAAPSPAGYVTDQANIIEPQARQQLETALADLERRSSIQLAVVTVNSLDGNDVADYTNRLFNAWGIGRRGKDNGVMLLVAPNERRMRIEVGYGLEGQLTDAGAGRILDDAVIPYFQQGDATGGIVNGASAISTKLTGEPLRVAAAPLSRQKRPPTLGEKIAGAIFFFLIFIVVARNPWLLFFLFSNRGGRGGGWSGGGFGGGGFGGFGGGSSGGGGASRGW